MPPVKQASDLYGLALDEFTPARDALVKQLKADGEKDEAARVAKLRKPSIAAWAVNQLVRTQSKGVEDLFAAGDGVAEAQAKGQADKLRRATAEQREELTRLVTRAEGLLDSEGRAPGQNVLERIAETLRAAALDPDCRAQVQDGCLTRELQFSGLGGFGVPAASASQPESGRDDEEADRQRQQREIEAAKERKEKAKQNLQQAKQDLRQAEKDLTSARRTRDRAAERMDAAEDALAEAGEELDELQRGGR